MGRIMVALIVGSIAVYCLFNRGPQIMQDEAQHIISVSGLAETPKACRIQNDSLIVKAIYFSDNGQNITRIHFTDHAGNMLAMRTSFYKLSAANAALIEKLIHVHQEYKIGYIYCDGLQPANALDSIVAPTDIAG